VDQGRLAVPLFVPVVPWYQRYRGVYWLVQHKTDPLVPFGCAVSEHCAREPQRLSCVSNLMDAASLIHSDQDPPSMYAYNAVEVL
jgi:hypothetical protein